jgi:hypothetical protein
VLAATLLFGALGPLARLAAAQACGERSAILESNYNRDCLLDIAKLCMNGLVHHDRSRVPFAKDVRFTVDHKTALPAPFGDPSKLGHDPAFADSSGARSAAPLGYPDTLSLIEAFKIRSGHIDRTEAIFDSVPYGRPSPWVR